ncbi:adenine phosphoribosyltransferase [Elusimicrobiota bacterium]
MDLKDYIRNVPGFPKPGIQFKDISTLVQDKEAFDEAIRQLVAKYKDKDINKVVAVESRGFIFGAPVALALGVGMVMVRKKGKLPAETINVEYELEYGTDILEVHKDAVLPGEKVLIIDDLLATGGTTKATADLMEKISAEIIGICFLIELKGLNGREKLKQYDVESLIQYDEI